MGKLLLGASVVALFIAACLLLYVSLSPPTDYAEISKQDPKVQRYLKQHPNAKYDVRRAYLTADGMVYAVDENWNLKRLMGSAGSEPVDGKDHYCWVVHWYDPSPGVPHIIDVFIDKETLKIVLIVEAI